MVKCSSKIVSPQDLGHSEGLRQWSGEKWLSPTLKGLKLMSKMWGTFSMAPGSGVKAPHTTLMGSFSYGIMGNCRREEKKKQSYSAANMARGLQSGHTGPLHLPANTLKRHFLWTNERKLK